MNLGQQGTHNRTQQPCLPGRVHGAPASPAIPQGGWAAVSRPRGAPACGPSSRSLQPPLGGTKLFKDQLWAFPLSPSRSPNIQHILFIFKMHPNHEGTEAEGLARVTLPAGGCSLRKREAVPAGWPLRGNEGKGAPPSASTRTFCSPPPGVRQGGDPRLTATPHGQAGRGVSSEPKAASVSGPSPSSILRGRAICQKSRAPE